MPWCHSRNIKGIALETTYCILFNKLATVLHFPFFMDNNYTSFIENFSFVVRYVQNPFIVTISDILKF